MRSFNRSVKSNAMATDLAQADVNVEFTDPTTKWLSPSPSGMYRPDT
jgi:hypothetical protein